MANRFPLIFNSGAGQIQELAASDNLDLTSSNLVNAGILFTSSGSQTAPSLQIGSGTTYNPGLYSPGTDQLAISTSGSGRVFVDASGNVGVGTASPAAKLEVNGKTVVSNESANPLDLYKYGTASPSILMYGANGTAASPTQTLTGDVIGGINAFGRGSSGWAGGPSVRITAIATENNGGTSNRGADIKFETVATGGTSLLERLRITSAGLLGLGVSAPQAKLHISDLTASALELMRLQVNLTSPSGNKSITWADSTDVVGRISVDYTSPTVKMRFGSLYNSGYQTSDLMTLTPTGLGIGISAPSVRLQVQNSIAGGSGGTIATLHNFSDTGGDTRYSGLNFVIGSDNGTSAIRAARTLSAVDYRTELSFWTNPTGATQTPVRAMTIDYLQRVGIGSASPSNTLEISKEANHGITLTRPAGGVNPGSFKLEVSSFGAGTLTADNNLSLTTGSSQQLIVNRGATESFRVDANSRLLVGTSTSRTIAGDQASIQLETAGVARASLTTNSSSTAGAFLNIAKSRGDAPNSKTVVASGDDIGGINFLGADGTNDVQAASITAAIDGTPGTNDMPGRIVLATTADGASTPTERMRIGSNGQVQIGRTSPVGDERLALQNTLGPCGYFFQGGNIDEDVLELRNTYNQSGQTATYIRFSDFGGTTRGSITATTSATSYNTSSDYRLKENVTPVSDGISRLKQLKPNRFNFIEDPDTVVDGFLAHEVQTIVPEAITGEKDEVDDDGNPVYQGIDQSKLVPLLTAALQEAIGEIESLKARVAALEAN